MDILNVQETIREDNSIFSLEDFPFNPITGTLYNNAGIIQINIENQAEYFLPSQSWLQIDGQLKKTTDQPYAAGDAVTLTNNAILYLFSNIKYHLGGNEIESVNEPGQATTMMGLLKYEPTFPGLNQCWKLDSSTVAADTNTGFAKRRAFILSSNPIGTFSFAIDLKHILGFADDYEKVVFGLRHSLQLNRKASNNDAIFRAQGVDVGKVDISKVTWWMPRVMPSQVEGYRLTQLLAKDLTLEAGFRGRQCVKITIPGGTSSYTWNLGVKSERPQFIIVGFQTTKNDNQEQNPALFDHCRVGRIKVLLNSTEYPSVDIPTDFNKNQYAGYYKRMADFKQSFYGVDNVVSNCGIDGDDLKNLFPLYVFDVSKQIEKLASSVVDVSIKMDFDVNIANATDAYALVISDRKLKFKTSGKQMSAVF